MDYSQLRVSPVHACDESTFQRLMQAHHYLGALVKIGHTIRYIATVDDQWLALLSLSAPALQCHATHTGGGEHGRIEKRSIWVSAKLNHYLDFPHVGQAFMIERETIRKKTRQVSREVVYGITSIPLDQATPEQVHRDNRGHWCVDSCHYIIDWNYDEGRSQIRTGFGPENMPRLRRFAIGLLKSKQK